MKLNLSVIFFLFRKRFLMSIMRLLLFLCCTLSFALKSNDALSQNIKVEKDLILTVDEVFKLIMNQTDYNFFYEKGMFNDFPLVNVKKGVINVNDLLKKSLSKRNMDIIVTENNSILIQENPSPVIEKEQQFQITGIIVDTNGLPLAGTNILEKGTLNGTQSDFDGKFSIQVKDNNAILVVSYIGFVTQEITLNNRTELTITLKENASNLDEVIVTGYGSKSRRNMTDSAVRFDALDMEDVPTPNLINTLVGKAAGIQINQLGGKVEGTIGIRIRGQASISAGNNPLYVLDGIPLINTNESTSRAPTNPLLTLSPNEIESIDVLKDASAAAIYGARGANGVVIITTKKGKEGKTSVSLNFSSGISEATNTLDFLNAAQYVELLTEAAENVGRLEAAEARFDGFANGTDWRNGEVDTDWGSLGFRTGHVRDVDFSVSGGTAKTNYFFSGAYNQTDGIIVANALERISVRSNISHTLFDKLKVGVNLNFSRVDIDKVDRDNSFTNPVFNGMQPPIAPVYDDSGQTIGRPFFPSLPHALVNTSQKSRIKRLIGKVYGEYEIVPSLKLNSSVSYDNFTSYENRWEGTLSAFDRTNGEVRVTNSDTENFLFSNYANFNKVFNYKHHLDVVAGTEYNFVRRTYTSVTGTQFPSDDFRVIGAAAEVTSGDGDISDYSFVSYFARASYTFNSKYLFKASIRRDGSSRFGSNKRFGTFPSLSAGWIISEEPFLKDSETLSFLKIRSSWGKVGNAEIGNFASRNLFEGESYVGNSGLAPSQAGNNNLTWESSSQTEIALEYGLFNNRITGDIAYYIKDTDGLLFEEPIIPSVGDPNGSGITRNIGRLTSNGIEFSVQTNNIQKNDFSWTTNFNVSFNENEIKELPNGEDVITGNNILREGEAVNSFYVLEYAGVNPENGDALWYTNTENPDGTLSKETTNNPGEASRIIAGNPNPEWIAGLTNTIRFKGIDFSTTFNGEWGASLYDSGARFHGASGSFSYYNQTTDQLRRWQNPGDITDVPQARLSGFVGIAHSTRFLDTGNFVRLRNVTLGYTFPKSVTSKIGMNTLRVYFSGHNLLTFTNHRGIDVESRLTTTINSSSFSNTFFSAPLAKTYSMGVNINF